MRRIIALIPMLALLCASAIGQGSIGLAVGIEPVRNSPSLMSPVTIYVPIKVGDSFRIEPEIGLLSAKRELGSNKDNSSLWRIGGGLLFDLRRDEQSRVYLGPRVAAIMASTEETQQTGPASYTTYTTDQTDVSFSAVIGGQYNVGLGVYLFGEAQFTYYSYGKVTRSPAITGISDPDRSMMSTGAIVGIGWYL